MIKKIKKYILPSQQWLWTKDWDCEELHLTLYDWAIESWVEWMTHQNLIPKKWKKIRFKAGISLSTQDLISLTNYPYYFRDVELIFVGAKTPKNLSWDTYLAGLGGNMPGFINCDYI